jgi:alanine racemase
LNYSIKHIAEIIGGELIAFEKDEQVSQLLIDSRRVVDPGHALFFALTGARKNGHHFIPALLKQGVRNFVVSETLDGSAFPGVNFIRVQDVLKAFQQLAAFHRKQFSIPVIGITGSNGKTIVKEWLYQLLQEKFNIVRSPKSYNSQVGVPLSVWEINQHDNLAIFEAGISQPGEMEKLQEIIQPTLGVFTHLGEPHSEGFRNRQQKLEEKIKLFTTATQVIVQGDDPAITATMRKAGLHLFTWGKAGMNNVMVELVQKEAGHSRIQLKYKDESFAFLIPFFDDASIENAINCCCVLLHFKIDVNYIREKMSQLLPVNMRLELKKGINHCSIINDSYSADLGSLRIALHFLAAQGATEKKTVILSDFLQSGLSEKNLYREIAGLLAGQGIHRVIGIGAAITAHLDLENTGIQTEFYPSTEDFTRQFRTSLFRDEIILVKGARVFAFEKIVQLLELKVHQTVLEINLDSIAHNLNQYQRLLKPSTRIMAMVKAFAYGSGGAEIAGTLQYHKVDYLGVAYADEGVELRHAGINLPIMVMNPEESSFQAITDNRLEPDLYSYEIFHQFIAYLQSGGNRQYPVHIEIETGMNRLGFDPSKLEGLINYLAQNDTLRVQSVFSHLAASEEAAQDDFTRQQFEKFCTAADAIEKGIGYALLRHLANSAAILRHPQMQLDMVRLGIGLYGVDSAGTDVLDLQPVATLKSTIAQIKYLKAGESVSYNRKGVVHRDAIIATVRIGYADGYPRRLGNGNGHMLIHGLPAPVIGTVCMDMTMVDVTDIPAAKEGDEVIIFGKDLPIQQLAQSASTITYEIMTGISGRVKRVYFEE